MLIRVIRGRLARVTVLAHGVFLSLDGLDGAGKSTQVRLLADWLREQGRAVVPCADPGGTSVGDRIRELLLHGEMTLTCEALLFMASRAQLVAEVIRPALDDGKIVLSDRFLLANVVYQGHASGLDPEPLWSAGRFATNGLEPDLTLVLDLPLELARTRQKTSADRLEKRDDAYHCRVREGFLAEAARRPERIRVVDASGSVQAVREAIRREVARVLAAHPGA
ncbi:MAG TPA: dTMP kinase [Gemmataceae bacterium]|nr:dTMP kinase [Gemmataceae bacterium]